jgi:predicted enzyme related to lactoylglutathione lyase
MTGSPSRIARLEHLNLTIPDQQVATQFYVVGLGLTRDPAMMVGLNNMWVNAGRSQFHLPTRPDAPQKLRGEVRLTLPDLDRVEISLGAAAPLLAGTCFDWTRDGTGINVICPWGNRIRLVPPGDEAGATELGIKSVVFDVPAGNAAGIAAFYSDQFGTEADLGEDGGRPAAIVPAGPGQHLVFRETADQLPPYDGHHIQIYISDFDHLRRQFEARGLVSADDGPKQFRITDIVDPVGGDLLYQVEHEIRSLDHPLFGRPLYNRNPDQTQPAYRPGRDGFAGTV